MSGDWLARAEEFGFHLKWGIPDVLLVSSALRNASQIKFLHKNGIGAIISLTEEIDPEAYQAIQELRIQRICAPDSPGVEFVDQLIAVYSFFRHQASSRKIVVIHNSLLDDERAVKFSSRLSSLHEAEKHSRERICTAGPDCWCVQGDEPRSEESKRELRTHIEARLLADLKAHPVTQLPPVAE